MTDEPDGAYDWPHAVGAESKARQWRLARGVHDTEMRSGDKIDELLVAYSREEIERLRGLLEAADKMIADQTSFLDDWLKGGPEAYWVIKSCMRNARKLLAEYEKLKGK